VTLKEQDADRRIVIWIGQQEAAAIVVGLQGRKPPRPLTQDLLASVLDSLGAVASRVIVTLLKDGAVHAAIHVASDGAAHEIDARASDALALAVRQKAPIFAEDAVLEAGKGDDISEFATWPTIWALPAPQS
jgi:bifunctional DNase/RNase